MADVFLDTAVIIDLLRNYPPAVSWKNTQGNLTFGITPIVYVEVIHGAVDKIAQQRAVKFLLQFEMIYFAQADMEWAIKQFLAHHLKHGVGHSDCFIAAPSYRLQTPLYTHNLKHMTPLLGILAQKPY